MNQNFSSLKPLEGANRSLRSRLDLKGELALATAPTVLILTVLALVEVLSRQHLLFASLASSAFLIYLDPQHVNSSMAKPRTSMKNDIFIGNKQRQRTVLVLSQSED